jgi:hypothetical protein
MEGSMEETIQETLRSLEYRDFRAWFANDRGEARDLMLDLIAQDAIVGVGDSSTIRQIGIIESLRHRETRVINPFDIDKSIRDNETFLAYLFRPMIEATLCDVFLTGVNALTQDGRLLSTDGSGNRVAGTFWGHPQVILAVGKNKIVRDLDEAFHRVKNLIAPEHAKRRGISGPPCSVTGECHDCSGKQRICNVTAIIEGRPRFTEIHLIVVNEDLGLGWDGSWPRKRIDAIAANHEKFKWTLPPEIRKSVDRRALWEGVKSLLRSKPE